MNTRVKQLLADLDEHGVIDLVKAEIEAGGDANELLRACQEGMVMVGQKFEEGTYFISDLMMAGEIFTQINALMAPKMVGNQGPLVGKVVAGTVKGDIHNIGKDLVVAMLKSANMEVTDLGVDVSAERFVKAVKETGAKVVGLSALMTVAFDSLKSTVDAFEKAGLRDKVKIMVGGGPVDGKVCKYAGADNWGADAQAAVRIAKEWLQ
jgi:methanogenic corrinoid protein MtbC1